MAIQFSEYQFVSDSSGRDGDLLVPLSVFGDVDSPPAAVDVAFPDGRVAVFEGGSPVFFVDSAAGTEEFVGWSYWECDESFDSLPDPRYVNLRVLSPDYDLSGYPSF